MRPVGRPRTAIESASDRTLRRRQNEFVSEMETLKAARESLIIDPGSPPAQPSVESIEPDEGKPPNDQVHRLDEPQFSPLQALAVLVDANLTKEAYAYSASTSREIGNNPFPSYPSVDICSCITFYSMNIELPKFLKIAGVS
ncbi:hypothetical protein QAD02_020571 [Eretmocerus hayati]|uniref:Uncharacterized protein n=1 Tax=Eretmocerus hayati TaxID=131215 RepID=A0ACC2PP23_9HYME|nr:hypothetical protein QAD02_020571 [Eretmocerus hayati]